MLFDKAINAALGSMEKLVEYGYRERRELGSNISSCIAIHSQGICDLCD